MELERDPDFNAIAFQQNLNQIFPNQKTFLEVSKYFKGLPRANKGIFVVKVEQIWKRFKISTEAMFTKNDVSDELLMEVEVEGDPYFTIHLTTTTMISLMQTANYCQLMTMKCCFLGSIVVALFHQFFETVRKISYSAILMPLSQRRTRQQIKRTDQI